MTTRMFFTTACLLSTTVAAGSPLDSQRGSEATIVVAFSIECPISNGYVPTLNRMVETYRDRGVSVVAINPNVSQSANAIVKHKREYKPVFEILQDENGEIAKSLGLTICPEACVLDQQGRVRYRGRIDDRYSRRGGAPDEARAHELRDAIDALLAGKEVTEPRTKAIGCPIQFAEKKGMLDQAHNRDPIPTYSREIVRVLQNNCQECHRAGGIGPFALDSYEQAVNWADDIRQFTADGTMPPWKPVDGFGDFKNRRAMSQEDKKLVARWVEADCPRGDERDLPQPREFTNTWRLGEPDLILEPAETYELAADGPDVYRCFVLPTDFDRNRYVAAIEVQPGNARVVHHVIAFLDTSGASERLDARDPGPGYTTSQGFPGFFPGGGLGGWAPGNLSGRLPDGMAKILPAGARVVMQVHYHKSGKPESDRTRLGIYFAKPPVKRAVIALPVMPPGGPLSGMTIPANAANHEVRGSLMVPIDTLAVSITPHMHLIGKDMKVTATLPNGTVVPMIHVTNWDFNWQEMYHYREPLELPKGTRIDVVAHFDNSSDNPRNPHRPPQTIHWGEATTDEMCIAFIEVAAKREAASEADLRLPTRTEAMRFFVQNYFARHGTTRAVWARRLQDLIDGREK
jgi:hypothetical protein